MRGEANGDTELADDLAAVDNDQSSLAQTHIEPNAVGRRRRVLRPVGGGGRKYGEAQRDRNADQTRASSNE